MKTNHNVTRTEIQLNINDLLMHCPPTSTAWLSVARSAFTDSFLPNSVKPSGALQGQLTHWGALIRIGWVLNCCQGRLDLSCGLCTSLSSIENTAPAAPLSVA